MFESVGLPWTREGEDATRAPSQSSLLLLLAEAYIVEGVEASCPKAKLRPTFLPTKKQKKRKQKTENCANQVLP